MSLMAGFDLVLEISNRALLDLIKSYMKVGSVLVNPPFDFNMPFGIGNAHVVVRDLQLDLNADDTVTLTLVFDSASVTTALNAVCPLDGSMTITAPILLTDLKDGVAGNQKVLAIYLSGADAKIKPSEASMGLIGALLFGAGQQAVQQLVDDASQALTDYITGSKLPNPTPRWQKFSQVVFNVVPGSNGSINPPQVEKLEVHCITGADRAHQALGAFAILLNKNDGAGNHGQKDVTALGIGEDFAVSIAPGAFHELVFCPALATTFATNPDNLPTTCGTGGSISVPGGNGLNLIKCADSFTDGSLLIDGTLDKSGFCYDAHATLSASVKFAAGVNSLTSAVNVAQPSMSVDIPFACWLGAALGLGPIGLITVGIADGVAQGIADDVANAAKKLGSFSAGIGVGGFGPATIGRVTPTTQGLTIGGTIALNAPPPLATPGLILTGSVVESSETVLSSGIYHSDSCPSGDWPYVEHANQEAGTFSTSAHLLADYKSEWSVSTYGDTKQLVGDQGKVTLTLLCLYPQPLASGGTAVTQPVEISFQKLNNNGIVLTNRPSDGNYAFQLEVAVTDCLQVQLNASADVAFNGDTADISGGFQQAWAVCVKELMDRLHSLQFGTFGVIGPELPPPVNYPSPDQLQRFIRGLALLGTQEADQAIVHTILAHGTSFNRALNALKIAPMAPISQGVEG